MIRLLQINGKFATINNKLLVSREGLYTTAEINDLVNNQGYIPVATTTEFDSMRLTGSRPMGVGTLWIGDYTTGPDKKYIQVKHINFSGFTFTTGWSCSNDYIYDGNMLSLQSITYTFASIFSAAANAVITLKNIDLHVNSTNTVTSALLTVIAYSGTVIDNIKLSGSNTQTTGRAGSGCLCGSILAGAEVENVFIDATYSQTTAAASIGLIAGENLGSVSNVFTTGTITTLSGACGVAFGQNLGTVTNVHVFNGSLISQPPTGAGANIGTFVGYNRSGGKISNSSVKGSLYQRADLTTRDSQIGGFVGRNDTAGTEIKNCYAIVTVDTNTRYIGGFVGFNVTGAAIINSYCVGTVAASGIDGGFCGFNNGTITNSYYDLTVSGRTDTGKGLPRTTAQMKAGTASSFILPNGTIDPDSLSANEMYTGWDTVIWDFLTTSDYPILK